MGLLGLTLESGGGGDNFPKGASLPVLDAAETVPVLLHHSAGLWLGLGCPWPRHKGNICLQAK